MSAVFNCAIIKPTGEWDLNAYEHHIIRILACLHFFFLVGIFDLIWKSKSKKKINWSELLSVDGLWRSWKRKKNIWQAIGCITCYRKESSLPSIRIQWTMLWAVRGIWFACQSRMNKACSSYSGNKGGKSKIFGNTFLCCLLINDL